MRFSFLKDQRSRIFLFGLILLSTGVAVWAGGGPSLFASVIKSASKSKAEAKFLQRPATPPGRAPQLVHVAVYDAGTYPREIRVPVGTIRLMVEDYSSQSGDFQVAPLATSTVERLTAAAPSAMAFPVGERRGELTLTLTAGEHRFGRSGQSPESRLLIIAE